MLAAALVVMPMSTTPTSGVGAIGAGAHTASVPGSAVQSIGARMQLASQAAKKETKVRGWKGARRSLAAVGVLESLRVTGPAGRLVKVQKKTASGRWKTIRVMRTTARRGLDVSFIAERRGQWRLRIPAVGSWPSRTTRTIRVLTRANEGRANEAGVVPSSEPAGATETRATNSTTKSITASGVSGGVVVGYGPGFAMDSLQNLRVGGPYSDSVSNRFRAERSGSLTAFRTWWKNGGTADPGYGLGDGGIISVTVETDNAGVPSGAGAWSGGASAGCSRCEGGQPGAVHVGALRIAGAGDRRAGVSRGLPQHVP